MIRDTGFVTGDNPRLVLRFQVELETSKFHATNLQDVDLRLSHGVVTAVRQPRHDLCDRESKTVSIISKSNKSYVGDSPRSPTTRV